MWIQTYTGRRFDYVQPVESIVDQINIHDIARALSMLCRYNGHTKEYYSVAEHSVYVSRLVPEDVALGGLLHDAAEAYIGDIPTPLKNLLPIVKTLEYKIMLAISRVFGLKWPEPRQVKVADIALLSAEIEQVFYEPLEWDWIAEPANVVIQFWPPAVAEAKFLSRYHELT